MKNTTQLILVFLAFLTFSIAFLVSTEFAFGFLLIFIILAIIILTNQPQPRQEPKPLRIIFEVRE